MKFAYTSFMMIVIGGAIIGSIKHMSPKGIFTFFEKAVQDRKGIELVEKFNPEKNMMYFPSFENKKLFESVEDLSICNIKDVRKYIYAYLTGSRAYTIRSIERSYKYMDVILKVFAENPDVPKDLALLPLLESGFDPFAVSRSSAVGLWQFLKGTSAFLGLKTNAIIDERRNIEKSTRAAVRHLRNMYKIYGSWELALAAYNGGGVQVSNAIKKTGTKSIWELREKGVLTAETREYVPKFIALLLIYKNQDRFNIEDDVAKPEKKELSSVTLKRRLLVKQVANCADIPEAMVRTINPELLGAVTPGTVYTIYLPVESHDRFIENVEKLNKEKKQFICKK